MPKQNRVTPLGEIIATAARGTLMGNRGRLHDNQGRIQRHHAGRRWIICRLQFKGRQRQVMAPNCYTELFFLDEATALAAGHRPCAECSRPRYNEFVAAWREANPALAGARVTADRLDRVLHRERIKGRQKVTYLAPVADLPDGAFIIWADQACLVWGPALYEWQPAGYRHPIARPAKAEVIVLTPRSVVGALAAGYRPGVHETARRQRDI